MCNKGTLSDGQLTKNNIILAELEHFLTKTLVKLQLNYF